ncbi:MAG: SLC13 family permease [Actinomycetes bacterium]
MDAHLLITGVVLLVLVVALVRETVAPAPAVLAAVVVLTLVGIVEPETAFAGFSSSATLTVAGLFIVARCIQDHTGLDLALRRLLGQGRSETATLTRLTLPLVTLSAVIANTPLVAATAPMVRGWAERTDRPPSRYLMPVSFAALLGGVITTIGTSTTLVVSGLVESSLGTPFGFLEITPVGLPVALAGAVVLIVAAPRLLPDRSSAGERVAAHERDYVFRMTVDAGGPLDGATVAEGGLRALDDLFLVRIDRDGHEIAPVGPDDVLRGGDELAFVGRIDHVREFTHEGLTHAEQGQLHLLDGDLHGLHEVVIGRSSDLVGRTLKEASFRGRFGAAVLAIHRAGGRVEQKLGTVPLLPGDSLLLHAGPSFAETWRDHGTFAVVVPLDDTFARASRRRWFVIAVVVAMVLVAATGLTSTFLAVLGATSLLVGSRTIGFREAVRSLDLDVLLIIAGAIGLGAAVEASGMAELIASGVAAAAAGAGPVAALAAVVIGTAVITEVVTNVAAAALMVPIAVQVGTQLQADPRVFALGVAIAASSSFLTPIGYQTNTIVYGLGGYRFSDYPRLGAPVTVVTLGVAIVVLAGML